MQKRNLVCFVAFATFFFYCTALSQGAIIYSGAVLNENFDTLGPAVTGQFSATIGIQNSIPGLTTWDGVKNGGTGTTNMNFSVDSGIALSGALYSYGASGGSDRALGALASGTNSAAIGVEIQNSSGQAITDVTITFTSEQWRSSTSVTNTLVFSYGTSAGGETPSTYLTSATMIPFTGLDAPALPFVAANGATDGNLPANQTLVSATFPVSVPSGTSLFIRWSDANDSGNDAGIGIDAFSFRAITVPEPASIALVIIGIAALAFCRRKDA